MTQYTKILIRGTVTVETGMHIGGGDDFSAIGAIDKGVIRDPLTRLPIIPGSSLKGKMRSLLARRYGSDDGGVARNPSMDHDRVKRLFGDAEMHKHSRLIFRDTRLKNKDALEQRGAKGVTEVKYENTIDRVTARANPRQIERVIPGSEFNLELVYELSAVQADGLNANTVEKELEEDFATLLEGLQLLQLDYLGGHGSRGYGAIKFSGLHADLIFGEQKTNVMEKLNAELSSL